MAANTTRYPLSLDTQNVEAQKTAIQRTDILVLCKCAVKYKLKRSHVLVQQELNQLEASVAAHIELCSFPKVFLCLSRRLVTPVLAESLNFAEEEEECRGKETTEGEVMKRKGKSGNWRREKLDRKSAKGMKEVGK